MNENEANNFYNEILPKREARESAFILVFEKLFNPECSLDDILQNSEVSNYFKIDGFTKNLVSSVYDNLDEIDNLIKECLVNWTFDRISNVSKSILRLGVAELKYKKTESVVIFNEYVLLSKKYSEPKESGFVNGILASVEKKVRI